MELIKKTLFLPIEIIARELDSKLLLAHKALEKGYSVVVGTKGAVYKIARSYGSGIYFYKDHSPLSSLLLQELHVAGLKIVVLDEEGLSWPSPDVYTKRIDDKVLQVSNAIFAWGQKQYEILIKTSAGNKKKIHIVGNPRFDILHSKNRQFLKDQSKQQLSFSDNGYVLINSMFTPGNWNPLLYGTPSYVEHMRDRGLIHNDEDFEFYTKVSENAAQLFDAYVSLLKRLSKSFPSTKFVIRPHPDENQEKWRNLFASDNNIIVENGGSAIYWILGAKVLIYTGCTTAIEAWAMNKPTLRYHPIPETEFGPYLPNKFGKTIKTEKEVVEELKVVLSNPEDGRHDVDPDFVQSYIKNGFSADAAENIVRVLDSFYVGDEHLKNSSRFSLRQLKMKIRLLLYFDIKKRWGRRVLGKLKRTLQQKNVEKESKIAQAKSQKFPGLTREDIEMRLISLDRIISNQKEKKREIVQIAPNTFKIENHYS
jgi:surface carbohydrate biosynthesis protein